MIAYFEVLLHEPRTMDVVGNTGGNRLGINSPRAFVCYADHAVQLMGRHALLAGRHEMGRQ